MKKKWEIHEKTAEAVKFAASHHDRQARKGSSIPYLVHPLNVAKSLIRYGAGPELAQAGILHDIVEDTPATLEEVKERFGSRVAELVEHASEPDKDADWRSRKEHTVQAVQECDDLEILALKCADKLDNLRDTSFDLSHEGEAIWERFNTPNGKVDQAWYYGELSRVFSAKLESSPWQGLAEALAGMVGELFGEEFA